MSLLVSLLFGIAVGAAYALAAVKSPAPPIAALSGLLGIVIGEQGFPWVQGRVAGWHAAASPSPTLGRHSDSR